MTPGGLKKIDDQVYLFRLPLPFPVGSTNVYFIADSLPTLIDTGPNLEAVAEDLRGRLQSLGYHFADIKRLLITHPHIDHFGLAARIKMESGARVYAAAGARPFLEDIAREWEENNEYFKDFFYYCGVPRPLLTAFLEAGRDYVKYGCGVDLDEPLADGAEIPFDDFSLKVLAAPGHTPHDLCFESPQRRLLFVGDTLSNRIAPSTLMARPAADGQSRPHVVLLHMKTLKRLMNTQATLALPGHGVPFENPRCAAEKALRHHRRRCDEIFAMLNGRPKSPYELAMTANEELCEWDLFMWISEAVNYLDLLEEQGKVLQEFQNGRLVFRKSAD